MHRQVQRALAAWREAVRREERVGRLRERDQDGRRAATLARLERQARDAEGRARERYARATAEAAARQRDPVGERSGGLTSRA